MVGGGVAAYVAAAQAASMGLQVVHLAGSGLPGGLVANVGALEDYPAAPAPVSGAELVTALAGQADGLAVRRIPEAARSIESTSAGFVIAGEGGPWRAGQVIAATGASLKSLDAPGAERFTDRGLLQCAWCNAGLFRGRPVVVVGGGDSALQEALHLARHAKTVTVVVRGEALRARHSFAARAADHDNIEFRWEADVLGLEGETTLEAILIRERYDTPPQDSGLDVSTGQGAVRFVATQHLTEGTLRFSNYPYFKGASLFEPHEEKFQRWTSSHTPWSYNSGCDWGWNVYEDLRRAIDQRKCSVSRGIDALGREVDILRCDDLDRRDYYFSSAHGGLLVQLDLYLGHPQQLAKNTCVTDIVRAPGGGYFPRRTLSFSHDTAVGDPNRNLRLVKVLVSNRVDFTPKLRDEDFELTVAAGTGVNLGMDSRATGGFATDRKLLARDLPQLKQELIESTARRRRLQSLGLTSVPTAESGSSRRLAVRLLPWLLATAAIASLAWVVGRQIGRAHV